MDSIRLSIYLEQSTYAVEGFDEGKKYTSGSAVAINSRGDLMTAAHVVTNRLPVRDGDVNDPNTVWIARTKNGRYYEYKPMICGFMVKNEYMREPLTVDLAVMRCVEQRTDVAYLPISSKKIKLGERILMAGFPDEMELPFKFDRTLDYSHPEIRKQHSELKTKLEITKRLLMIKSGIIGNIVGFKFSSGIKNVEGDIFYIDNSMHTGASGRPVINTEGHVIGVITLRAVTEASTREITGLEVPSGSSIALTASTVSSAIEMTL